MMDKKVSEIVEEFAKAVEDRDRANLVYTQILHGLNERIAREGPMKIGDIIICNDYSFKDKSFKVETVRLNKDWFNNYEIIAKGRILKADGTPGKNKGKHTISVKRS